MPAKAGYPPPATTLVPLAQAGELSLKAYRAEAQGRDGKLEKTKSQKDSKSFIEKHCRSDVSEEWTKVDDGKIAKLRGILAALQEENQSTQLLKKESEDKEARRELEATRSSVDMRLSACKEKEALFVKKQAALRQHVLENEKSLQELETNIEKGEKKSKDEQAECRRLDQEIRSLERDLDEQEVIKSTEQKKIERMSQYKRFLEMVVTHGDVFNEENDIDTLMNRHNTLEAGNTELHQANAELTSRLSRVREECLRVQTKLQNEHLMISSKLHECQVTLDRNRAESQELEQRLNRALEEKELKESQVGVIQMAIGQLFTRTVHSCRLQQRKKAMVDATEVKFAPVRGDSGMSDVRLEEMLRQIIERVEDLRDMYDMAKEELGKNDTTAQVAAVVDEVDIMDKVKFVQHRGDRSAGQEHSGEDQAGLSAGQSAHLRGRRQSDSGSAGTSGSQAPAQAVPAAETPAPRQETFVTQE